MEKNATIAQAWVRLRRKDTDVHMQDGQEISKKCLNLPFCQVQGSREVS